MPAVSVATLLLLCSAAAQADGPAVSFDGGQAYDQIFWTRTNGAFREDRSWPSIENSGGDHAERGVALRLDPALAWRNPFPAWDSRPGLVLHSIALLGEVNALWLVNYDPDTFAVTRFAVRGPGPTDAWGWTRYDFSDLEIGSQWRAEPLAVLLGDGHYLAATDGGATT
jgi:hypothetical protein